MTDHETLRIIDRALWVDHGDGNLDALTFELPVWADEWAERIVAAVNGQPVIETAEALDALPPRTIVVDRHGLAAQCGRNFWYRPGSGASMSSDQLIARCGPVTVLRLPTENGER
ncbi:hypothetical protein [Nocardia sp. NPDC019255]|uniref:hypothetical protein n=1 Tax=Nocardia sp. NPDC019255 TaxID=3154591 RepID=UPI0033D6DFAD